MRSEHRPIQLTVMELLEAKGELQSTQVPKDHPLARKS